MSQLKFQSDFDRAQFAIEEGLVTFNEAIEKDSAELEGICEASVDRKAIKERRRRKKRVRDHSRSRQMKKLWKSKKRNFTRGIRKFHKSVKGKKLHQRVARNKKQGKYRNIHEAMTQISSLITHLTIQTQYTSTINEEVESELLLEEGTRILNPILEAMSRNIDLEDFTLSDIVEKNMAGEAKEFIEDVVLSLDEDDDDELDDDDEDEPIEEKGDVDPVTGLEVTGDYEDRDLTPEETRECATKLAEKLQGNNDNEVDGKDIQSENDSESDETAEVEESLSYVESELEDIVEGYEEDDCNLVSGDQFSMINEAAGDPDVDGEHVIAKVVGPAFFPGTVSRNNVEYTNELWEKALNRPEFQRELKARRVYGTIGHDQVINDKAIRDERVGHIVTKMWIDSATNIGMAEYLLLNTGPGRMTKILLGAKSEFRVSTRCRGKFKSRSNARGHKEPNPDLFFIKGVDFVNDPGFLGTSAELVS